MILVEDVSVSFPVTTKSEKVTTALQGVSVTVPRGEFFTVIGPSGCGKSTLLNVIAGLQKASAGKVQVNKRHVTGPLPDTTAVVFQEHSLFPWRSVQDNVEAGLEFRGVPKAERRAKAAHYLNMVSLSDFANHFPRQLSGGMRQRVAIARALCLETPVLLMDEPFGALDEQTRMILGEEVSRIFAGTDKTIVLVTHSLAEAVFLSDRIVVMGARPGRIRETILVDHPHPRTPEFMTSPLFHNLRDHLFDLLHDEMRQSVLGTRAAQTRG